MNIFVSGTHNTGTARLAALIQRELQDVQSARITSRPINQVSLESARSWQEFKPTLLPRLEETDAVIIDVIHHDLRSIGSIVGQVLANFNGPVVFLTSEERLGKYPEAFGQNGYVHFTWPEAFRR